MSYKVLHLLDHSVPLQSGYAFRTLAILREQHKLGWTTVHLTSPKHYNAASDEESASGFQFYRTRPPASWLRAAPVFNQAMVVFDTERRLDEVVLRESPDIIHAHSPALNGLAALRVARKRKLPFVYEMRASWEDAAVDHGSTTEGSLRYRLSRALESYVLKRADAITTICDGLRKDIVSRGVPANRVNLIPNAVDIADFPLIATPDENLRRELKLGDGPVLGFLGSFYGYEGLDLLVAAVPLLISKHPKLQVVLVGGGPAENALRTQAVQLGIADRIHFIGRVPQKDVMRYYSIVDLLVYPRKSMRLTETVTPLKPLEAMAQGRVFIASDVGGHRELIPKSLHDGLFAPGDATALASKIHEFLANQSAWPARVQASRMHVEQGRTWERSCSAYVSIYQSAVDAASGLKMAKAAP